MHFAVAKPKLVSAYFPTAEMTEEDRRRNFYEKLNNLSQSSALSILDTTLDLHQLYNNVTQRGGYHQVTKEGKWEEVASSASRKTGFSWAPNHVKKMYETVLYMFEQTYDHYRCPVKPNKRPDIPLVSNSFSRKRKHGDGLYVTQQHFSDGFRKSSTEKTRRVLETTRDEIKETRKERRVPLGSRNCYQMFIKMETDRLKSIIGDVSSAQLIRGMNEAWKHLSSHNRRPYIEASKKDNDRFVREMAAYEKRKREQRAGGSHVISCQDARKQKFEDFGETNSMQFDGDYHVALQPDDDHESALVKNESMVQIVVGLMKNARPCDPIFQIEWDGYGGLIDINPS